MRPGLDSNPWSPDLQPGALKTAIWSLNSRTFFWKDGKRNCLPLEKITKKKERKNLSRVFILSPLQAIRVLESMYGGIILSWIKTLLHQGLERLLDLVHNISTLINTFICTIWSEPSLSAHVLRHNFSWTGTQYGFCAYWKSTTSWLVWLGLQAKSPLVKNPLIALAVFSNIKNNTED